MGLISKVLNKVLPWRAYKAGFIAGQHPNKNWMVVPTTTETFTFTTYEAAIDYHHTSANHVTVKREIAAKLASSLSDEIEQAMLYSAKHSMSSEFSKLSQAHGKIKIIITTPEGAYP